MLKVGRYKYSPSTLITEVQFTHQCLGLCFIYQEYPNAYVSTKGISLTQHKIFYDYFPMKVFKNLQEASHINVCTFPNYPPPPPPPTQEEYVLGLKFFYYNLYSNILLTTSQFNIYMAEKVINLPPRQVTLHTPT